MLASQNKGISGNLSSLVEKAGAKVAAAIQNASSKTGVDFSYLMQQAQIESSFKTDAKACSSSATGLYQFIDKTWLSMVNKYGDKYGLSDLADQISDNGKVACNKVKKDILELRKNPELCSLMAAEMASDNKNYLEQTTGRSVGATDLYLAHFMGPAGAGKFLKAMDKNSSANAAALFPSAAEANPNVFYDKTGKPKSLEQVYAQFDKKFSIQANDTACTASVIPDQSTTGINTADVSTENVLAALRPTLQPLVAKNHSLFTDSVQASDSTMPLGMRKMMYAPLSPIDVLELLKTQDSTNRYNA